MVEPHAVRASTEPKVPRVPTEVNLRNIGPVPALVSQNVEPTEALHNMPRC